MTSFPLSERTSSIHFDVDRKDALSVTHSCDIYNVVRDESMAHTCDIEHNNGHRAVSDV